MTKKALWAVILVITVAVACDPVEETTDDGATSSSEGGTPSVAATVVGVGGGEPGVSCTVTYTNVPQGPCDLLLQDCATGSRCEVVFKGAGSYLPECVPEHGLKGPGASCLEAESCRGGNYCVFGKCSPICCPGTNEPCGPGGLCNVSSPFGTHEAQTCSYLDSCTLFTDDCEDNFNCYPLMTEGVSVCAPTQGPVNGEGEACSSVNGCEDSMICTNNVCRFACFLDMTGGGPGAGGCLAMQTCQANGNNPPQNIGACG